VHVAFIVDATSDAEAARLVGSLLREAGERQPAGEDDPAVRAWALDEDVLPKEWEPFIGSGIPEIVAEMFPPQPRPEQYLRSDGTVDQAAFDGADDQWRDECMSLALSAANLPRLLERLDRTERFRDAVIDVMARYPLPDQPRLEDYPEQFFGTRRFDEHAYQQEYIRWQQNVQDVTIAREYALATALDEDGRRTAYLPAQFHREWIPADLLAVTTLRELLDQPRNVTGRLLARSEHQELAAMLFAADPVVRIPDPDRPDGPEIYEGPASEAHAWIPPGVYPATGLDDHGEFRVVVGRIPVGNTTTASAAFPPAEHDSTVLNRIARVLEDGLEHDDPREVLTQVDVLVTATGRTAGGSQTLLERGAMLGDLLHQREQQLRTDADDTPRQDRPEGPELDR